MTSASTDTTSPANGPSHGRLHLLFLAARPATVTALQQMLKGAAGIEFHLAVEPEEVEATARRESPDLILLDLPWAGRAGRRLIERLRAAGIATPIAVLGDFHGTRAREAARHIGANGYTPDAASPDLLKVVRALAGTRRPVPAPAPAPTARHSNELAAA